MSILLQTKKVFNGPIDLMEISFSDWMSYMPFVKWQLLSDHKGIIQVLLTSDISVNNSDYQYIEKFFIGAGYYIKERRLMIEK
jgi:hypothetical protein